MTKINETRETRETATVETFWNAILGANSDAARIVDTFSLSGQTEKQIGEWLDSAWEGAKGEGYTQIVSVEVWQKVRDELFAAAQQAD